MKPLLALLLCTLALPVYLGSSLVAQEQEVPAAQALRSRGGTPVKIALGREYKPAEEFNGFLKESTGSSVLLHQSDRRGLTAAVKSFTDPAMLKRHRRKLLKKSEKLTYQGYDAFRIELEQEIPGAPESRIVDVLVYGDDEACCTAQVSWYVGRGKGDMEALRAALDTVVWDRPVVVDPFAGFTWDLQYARGKQFRLLKHAQTMENVVVYTDNGQVDFENTGRPLLVAQRVPNAPKLTLKPLEEFSDEALAKGEPEKQEGERPIGAPAIRNGDAGLSPVQRQLKDARTEYAKSRLGDVPGLENLSFDEVRYFSVDGMSGIEILASATEIVPELEGGSGEGEAPAKLSPFGDLFPPDEDEGPRTISLYELVVFGRGEHADEHWVMNGRIWQRIGKNWMKEFQKAARTFRIIPDEDQAKKETSEADSGKKAKGAPGGIKIEKGGRRSTGD